MYVSQKIRLFPTKSQIKIFQDSFNYSRYLYNKGLEEWNNMYAKYKTTKNKEDKPNQYSIRDYLRHNREEWEINMLNNVIESVSVNISSSFNMFFKGVSKYPKFKSKKRNKNSFNINRKNDFSIRILNKYDKPDTNGKYLKINKITKIKMSEKLRFIGNIKSVTISQKANQYYASFIIDIEDNTKKFYYKEIPNKNQEFCGIDLGVKTLATIATKDDILIEKSIIKTKLLPIEHKINSYQKMLSKKIYGSKKYNVMRIKLQKLYLQKHNLILDTCHKLTSYLCKNYRYITIEDLSVNNMIKNHNLSKYIASSMFYEFRRQLDYKSKLYGNTIIIADMWFPSSQICSYCGNVLTKDDKLKLSDRIYKCPKCGNVIDRDDNAAINLRLYGMRNKGMA